MIPCRPPASSTRTTPTAGNRHLQQFAATTDPGVLRVLRMVSPGMIQRPTAAVAVCVDRPRALAFGFPPGAPELIVCLGHPAERQPAPMRAGTRVTWRDLTRWVGQLSAT